MKREPSVSEKTSGITQRKSSNVVNQKITRRVHLLFYGGALKVGDNSAFEFSAKNVRKDYMKYFPNDSIIFEFISSAKTMVDIINNQKKGNVASLDLFFHGSKWGLYMYKGSSMNKTLSVDDVSNNNLNAGLYGGFTTGLTSTDASEEKRTIDDIDFSVFIDSGAIIEIHGCESGGDLIFIDSISKNLSEKIPNGYVIGHTTKAYPNINDTKVNEEQDYRHGERAIWKNGTVIKKTTKQGWLNLKGL
ncbi:TPA: hypothetical protein N2G40_003203 [Salmonella enterica]|nr:hypothetical protein [Salmonella enterica]ELO8298635.1 hypothetical protein [Salmonella enterica]ELT4078884.1 hypothetical protein [Salmonella enterica]HCL5279901.1 hypothetical protein [Salmonella enterica]